MGGISSKYSDPPSGAVVADTSLRPKVLDLVGEMEECTQVDMSRPDRGKLTLVLILLEKAKSCLNLFR